MTPQQETADRADLIVHIVAEINSASDDTLKAMLAVMRDVRINTPEVIAAHLFEDQLIADLQTDIGCQLIAKRKFTAAEIEQIKKFDPLAGMRQMDDLAQAMDALTRQAAEHRLVMTEANPSIARDPAAMGDVAADEFQRIIRKIDTAEILSQGNQP